MARPTVLVLDDNPAFVRVIEAVAEKAGLAIAATDDPDAFPCLLERDDVAGAIIDCMLGDRSGLSILARIAAVNPALPTLVVSGFGDAFLAQAEQVGRYQGLRRLSTLAKPFRAEALREFFADILAAA